MRKIYGDIFDELIMILENTVENISLAYDANDMSPLFCVSKLQFKVMKSVAQMSGYQVLNACKKMCLSLCYEQGIEVIETDDTDALDFIISIKNNRLGVIVSNESNFMPQIEKIDMHRIENIIVIVLQDSQKASPTFTLPRSFRYRNYPYKEMIKNITLKQFFDMIDADDYDDFLECVGRYNFEAEQKLGMTVSPIPTQVTLEKHRVRTKKELRSFFYEKQLLEYFTDDEILIMKKWFCKNCDVMVDDSDFSSSFLSSEWYYHLQDNIDCRMDQTAIIAGYLKSIEQLLCMILLSLSDDNYFYFYTKKTVRDQNGPKKLPLSHDNINKIQTMAGNLLDVIEKKKYVVLFRTNMTDRVIAYLKMYFSEFRNGYFHKDNIYGWEEIKKIRTSTYCAYFMILSTFKIDKEKLKMNY